MFLTYAKVSGVAARAVDKQLAFRSNFSLSFYILFFSFFKSQIKRFDRHA